MIIDIIVFFLLVLALFKGWRNGLVLAIFSFLSFIIGLAAALKLSAVVAGYLGDNTSISQRWLPVLAFVLVFFLVVLLVRLGAKAIEGVLQLATLGWLNKLGGIIFYGLLYLFIFSVLLFYAQQLNIIKPQTADVSVTYLPHHLPSGSAGDKGAGCYPSIFQGYVFRTGTVLWAAF